MTPNNRLGTSTARRDTLPMARVRWHALSVRLPDRIIHVWDSGMFRLVLVILTALVTATWMTSHWLDNMTGLNQPTATLVAGLAASLGSVLIGALALFFAWRNTRATLRQQLLMAERQEVARVESDAHKSIAWWLGKHPVLREGEIFYSTSPFEAHLSVPGYKLLVKARLYAADNVWELFLSMRDAAYYENELVRNVQLAIQSSLSNDKPFGETSNAQAAGWESPNDASRDLRKLRDDWISDRTELEATLRQASRRGM
jgi:hypothetical protein